MTGLVLLDKPQGMTSFLAVAQVRRLFGEKRAGHTGTLDPMATGVLPILLGRATRLSDMLLEADKSYTAEILLGTVTDTLDITGNVLETHDVNITDSQLEHALQSFRGVIYQKPPMFSALKKDGVRLYDLARKGVDVERESRRVEIKELTLIERSENTFKISITCSKGTYIRSLADDIGKMLGCGATMSSLRRTATGGFNISDCVTLDSLRENPDEHLLSAEKCAMHFPALEITDKQRIRYLNGGDLFADRVRLQSGAVFTERAKYRVHDREGRFLGISEFSDGSVKVKCIIFEGET